MGYVCVGRGSVEQADQCREYIMQAALDLCAGKISEHDFDRAQLAFACAYDAHQPTGGRLTALLVERLGDFYPVAVEEADEGYKVEYRHKGLPQRESVSLPDGIYDKRHPAALGVETDGKFDITTMEYADDATRHLIVTWQEKVKPFRC